MWVWVIVAVIGAAALVVIGVLLLRLWRQTRAFVATVSAAGARVAKATEALDRAQADGRRP